MMVLWGQSGRVQKLTRSCMQQHEKPAADFTLLEASFWWADLNLPLEPRAICPDSSSIRSNLVIMLLLVPSNNAAVSSMCLYRCKAMHCQNIACAL